MQAARSSAEKRVSGASDAALALDGGAQRGDFRLQFGDAFLKLVDGNIIKITRLEVFLSRPFFVVHRNPLSHCCLV